MAKREKDRNFKHGSEYKGILKGKGGKGKPITFFVFSLGMLEAKTCFYILGQPQHPVPMKS